MKHTQKTQSGFTFIETTLATAFLAVIILAVAILIVQITATYQKGVTLKAVNEVGQQIIDDVTRSVGSSNVVYSFTDADLPRDADHPYRIGNRDGFVSNDEALAVMPEYFLSYEFTNATNRSGTGWAESHVGTQRFGAFCVGDYAYIWNTGYTIAGGNNGLKIATSTSSAKRYRFARVSDVMHTSCSKIRAAVGTGNDASYSVTLDSGEAPVELIYNDANDLALYDFQVYPVSQSKATKQSFVSGSFILATVKGNVSIMTSGDFCGSDDGRKVVGGVSSEFDFNYFDYCAVNKFNFSAHTGGNIKKKG